jgi:hypothetical protein
METREYYITNGDEQLGPFKIEQLKDLDINSETSVWYEGIGDWTLITNVEELNYLVKKSPPPFKKETVKLLTDNSKTNDSTNFFTKIFGNRYVIFLGLILFVVGIYYISSNQVSNYETKSGQSESSPIKNTVTTTDTEVQIKLTPEELKEKLLIEEYKSPKKYISCEIVKILDNKIQTRNPTLLRRSKWKKDGYNIVFNFLGRYN